MKALVGIAALASSCLHAQVKPVVSQRIFSEQVNVIRLAPRYATAIRMPEPVSSVIVGDPSKFLAEHSEKEPTLVLVKPVVEESTESNLLVMTAKGEQISFVLRSEGATSKPVDFVVNYRRVGSFLVEESGVGSSEIARTEQLGRHATEPATIKPSRFEQRDSAQNQRHGDRSRIAIDRLLECQRRAELPVLYGMRPPSPDDQSDYLKAGVSEVLDHGREVVVLFSVVNPQEQAIEILPPQVQLAGRVKKGFLIKHKKWGTSEQLAVKEFLLSRRRLGPGDRADGVVVFDRPSFKQSNESLFLQMAESGAVDKPALAPIGFGVSSIRKEASDDE
jgi:hypothetical protein